MSRKLFCVANSGIKNVRLFSTLYRSITVRPSLRPYNELAVISPGVFKIPSKPFDMTVKYIDSSPDVPKPKTVVAVHGTPGSCEHFELLAKHFQGSDSVRVVAPSFPDFKHTRENKFFWHTTPEKVNFLRQFLADLNIESIDCFVCHSFGVHCIVALWDNPEQFKIRSVCMFAPQPVFDHSKLEENKKIVKRLFMFNNSLWYNLLQAFKIHQKSPFPLNFVDINEFLVFCAVTLDEMTFTFEDRFRRTIKNSTIPVSLLFGSREKLVKKDAQDKLNAIMGLRSDQIVQLDSVTSTAQDVVEVMPRLNSYWVEGGGHLVHIKNHELAHRMIENLLARC